jgi:CRISPR-associated protein Cas2
MHYLVSYDISSARTRRLAVKWCKQAGLRRMQKSVFAGRGHPARIHQLQEQLKPLLGKNDRLCVMPLEADHWKRMKLTGDGADKQQLSPDRGTVKFY